MHLIGKCSTPRHPLRDHWCIACARTEGMIDALLDSGADVSLISESSVQKRRISTTLLDRPIDVVLANRSRQRATRCVSTLTLTRGPWEDQIRCVVVPNLAGPLFLGRDWLSK